MICLKYLGVLGIERGTVGNVHFCFWETLILHRFCTILHRSSVLFWRVCLLFLPLLPASYLSSLDSYHHIYAHKPSNFVTKQRVESTHKHLPACIRRKHVFFSLPSFIRRCFTIVFPGLLWVPLGIEHVSFGGCAEKLRAGQ